MPLEEIIKPDSVLCNANARSKKHCIEILSELLVRSIPDTAADDVFANLIKRERLGCTSLSDGVAFPHCRVEGLEQSCAAMIKLSEAIDFDCSDGEPVDLVFGLLVPKDVDDSQINDIKNISATLADIELRKKLRACNTSNELYTALISANETQDEPALAVIQGS
ncbi:MAG: PTS sugar transporter subunit IIA [Woeseiaceae bacterium]|nr:PTS sugar transporter subunit IIA [Woeseiaceae bacterium]